jgi:hypothetical protein
MNPEPLSTAEIEVRRPVWDALSTLFLDTDVSLDLEHRARTLAASPYSIVELERILVDEVFPVCSWNLLSVAGEWAGFDQGWLEEKIMNRMRRRFRLRLGFGHLLFLRSADWATTRRAIESLRTGV